MTSIKDRFSEQAIDYSRYRPGYPEALYQFILTHTPGLKSALDVATGNGQVANILSRHFEEVYAIDISENQLLHSIKKPNIYYSVARAEATGFENHKFDLITVGQAAHWFQLSEFYAEVRRIIKPGGLLAMFGYQLLTIDPPADKVIIEFYNGLLGDYWDPERKSVDEGYMNLPFPFQKLEHSGFKMEYNWSLDQLLGFLGTWSAVRHYIKKNKVNPLDIMAEKFREAWGTATTKRITFPVFLLAAKVT